MFTPRQYQFWVPMIDFIFVVVVVLVLMSGCAWLKSVPEGSEDWPVIEPTPVTPVYRTTNDVPEQPIETNTGVRK